MATTVQAISKPYGMAAGEIGIDSWEVLHAFKSVCNLSDSRGTVLSLVQPSIGNGPFNIVVPVMDFTAIVDARSAAVATLDEIHLGSMLIDLKGTPTWNPTPHWGALRMMKDNLSSSLSIIERLIGVESPLESFARIIFPDNAPPDLPASVLEVAKRAIINLGAGLMEQDESAVALQAKRLAGLGGGLTPAGDDFLMGTFHAYWACLSRQDADRRSKIMLEAATGKTGTLSSAWLQAAADGKAGEAWHVLIEAIVNDPLEAAVSAARKILPTGHSSGADALAGFTFACRRLLA